MLVLVFVLACLAAALIVRTPWLGVVVWALLATTGDLQHFTGGASVAKAVLLAVAAGFLVNMAVTRPAFGWCAIDGPLCCFGAAYCAATLARIAYDLASAHMAGYVLTAIMLIRIVQSRRTIVMVFWALLTGASVAAFVTLAQWFSLTVPLDLYADGEAGVRGALVVGPGIRRAVGMYNDPNAGAYPFVLMLPIAIALAVNHRSVRVKGVASLVGIVMACALAATLSRSGYIAATVGVVTVLLYSGLHSLGRFAAMATGLAIVLGCLFAMEDLSARFGSALSDLRTDRAMQYYVAYDVLQDAPLIGPGTAAFVTEMGRRGHGNFIPHSNLLTVAVESGLVGLAATLWLVATYYWVVVTRLKQLTGTPLRAYAVGAFAGTVAYQTQGLLVANMGWSAMWLVAMLPVSCLAIESMHAQKSLRYATNEYAPARFGNRYDTLARWGLPPPMVQSAKRRPMVTGAPGHTRMF